MEAIPYLGHTIRRWQAGSSTFLAWPEAGARLMHWSVTRGDGSVRDVIHWPDLTAVEDIATVRGGNPILFPFCGRSYHDGTIGQWQDPAGTVRPIPNHGIARQGRFRVADLHDAGFDAVLEPDAAAQASYPFEYEFRVSYRFAALSLACEFVLTNHGSQPLPWSAGHHFYFAVPWTEGHTREDYVLRLPAGRILRQDATGALAPADPAPAGNSLAEPERVDALHLNLKGDACSFGPRDASEGVTIKLGTAKVPPPDATFVTWSAAPEAPFYCVEPWMGPPNAPGNRVGLHWVGPGQTQRFCVEVLVH